MGSPEEQSEDPSADTMGDDEFCPSTERAPSIGEADTLDAATVSPSRLRRPAREPGHEDPLGDHTLTDESDTGTDPRALEDTAHAVTVVSVRSSQRPTHGGGPPPSSTADAVYDLPPPSPGSGTWRERLARETPGRYREASELGAGGFGRVIEVFDTYLERSVALKQLRTDASGPPRSMRGVELRFEHEARITGKLEHPGILPVYELGRRAADGSLYYVMRKVEGETLQQALDDAKSLEDRLHLLPHFIAACNAMAYAHARGVIHRDIKPDNIMVGRYGQTIVVDWGLAKVQGEEDVQSAALAAGLPQAQSEEEKAYTIAGSAVGTPSYMPPEQCLGLLDEIDARSDVYALGAVLYHILTGRPPFDGDTAGEIVVATVDGDLVPAIEREPDGPPELDAIASRALANLPEERYGDAEALARDVEAFLDGGIVGAHRYSRWQLLQRWFRRRWPLLAGAAALLAILLGAAYARRRELAAIETRRAELAADAERTRRQALLEQLDEILADAEGGATEARWLETYAFRIVTLNEPVARDALVQRLTEALHHPEPEVRLLAARSFSGIKTDASLTALTTRLEIETEERINVEIIHALGVYGDHRAHEAVKEKRWDAGQFSRLWDQTRLAYRMIPMPPLINDGADLSPDEWTDRGRALSNKGHRDAAIQAYSRALALDPNFARALNNRAIEYSRNERYEEALRDYDAALAYDPSEPKARFNRASVKRRIEDYAGAIADYTTLIEQGKLEPNALRNRAFAYRWIGEYELAIADYLRTIELTPKNPRAYYSLGNTYFDLERWEEAIAAYDRALTHNPEYVAAMVGRGAAHRMIGHNELAELDFDHAVETDPSNDEARINRAALRLAMGNEDAAMEDLEHCLVHACANAEEKKSLRHAARGIVGHGGAGRFGPAIADLEAGFMAARKRSDRAEAAIWGTVMAYRLGRRSDERLAIWRPRLAPLEPGKHWHDDVLAVARGEMTVEGLSPRTPTRYRRCLLLLAGAVQAERKGDLETARGYYASAEDVKRPSDLSCVLAAISVQALDERH